MKPFQNWFKKEKENQHYKQNSKIKGRYVVSSLSLHLRMLQLLKAFLIFSGEKLSMSKEPRDEAQLQTAPSAEADPATGQQGTAYQNEFENKVFTDIFLRDACMG